MARPLQSLKDLNPKRDLWRVNVRVIDLWTVFHAGTEHFEGILRDEKGDTIHFVIPTKQMPSWKTSIQQNMTGILQNGSLQTNDFQYKVSTYPYKLVFNLRTTFRQLELPGIAPYEFHFHPFGDILNGNYKPDLLVDIIGAVHQIQHKHVEGHITHKRMGFTLTDASSNVLHCTLWGDYALSFSSAFDQRSDSTPFVIILTHAQIQAATGKYPLQITSHWTTSKLLMNQELPPISDFKNSFTNDQMIALSTQSQSQLSAGSQLSDFEIAMQRDPVKSLQQIKQLNQDTYCITVATTAKIVVNEIGWCFPGCASCPKRPKPQGTGFICKCLKFHDHTVPRYKLEIEAGHNQHTYNFIFWDNDCQDIIGHSAQDLINKLRQDGEDESNSYPQLLDEMISRTLALRVKVQPRSRQCSVMKAWDNPKYVRTVLDQIERQEETSQSLKGNVNTNVDIDVDSQSQSAMADHDPQIPLTLTPVKRVPLDGGLEDLTSPTFKTTQQSSTKPTKIIKTEKN